MKSGLEANISFYKSHSFLGFSGISWSVKDKIFPSKTLKTTYEIDGQWDRTIELKDVHSGRSRVLYDAKEAIEKLNTPSVINVTLEDARALTLEDPWRLQVEGKVEFI